MKKIENIILCGVGGQGLLKASGLLASAAFYAGYQVKKAEVHGLAQRGGSLFIQIRFGAEVFSPLVDPGSADYLLGFEKLEAYRYMDYLKPDGLLIYDSLELLPAGVSRKEYPGDLDYKIRQGNFKVSCIDALSEAVNCGDSRMQNVIMLRELNRELKLPQEHWERAFKESFSSKAFSANWKLFQKV